MNSYYRKVPDGTLSDIALVSLCRIVNAWINEDIETSVKRGYNKVNYLYNYNYKIIECIRDDKIREKLMSYGKCSIVSEKDTDNHINYSSSDYNKLFYEIKEKGYCKEIEEKIITMFSDVYSGQVKMLITIGNMIDKTINREFISNCVVQYIIMKRKYGYLGIGANQLIDSFYNDFSDNDWMKLLDNIIYSPYSSRNIEGFYSVNTDIETLCLYYYKAHRPDQMSELCENMLNVHWSWLTSCGLTNLSQYKLSINNRINSLEEFARYQLGDSDI